MSSEDRRYQARFAERGAEEITDETVEFVLLLEDLGGAPVVAGSIADPVRAHTEIRPFSATAVDRDGVQTGRFTADKEVTWEWLDLCPATRGRWDMVGRLMEVRWQLTSDDPVSDPWTTYGTGRCSGFDEAEGPGRYRLEISDESWKARKHVVVFENADTTQLWPAGVRPGVLTREFSGPGISWRGLHKPNPAFGEVLERDDNLHRIILEALTETDDPESFPWLRGGMILDSLISWLRSDRKDEVHFDASSFPDGNFKTARLRYGSSVTLAGVPDNDYEIVSFGGLDEDTMFRGLEQLEQVAFPTGIITRLRIWVRSHDTGVGPLHPPSNLVMGHNGFIYAPEALPSDLVPLHIGVNNPDHDWGTDGGYMHVADLHRRVWDKMGLRYNAQALTDVEADLSFPAIATSVGGEASNPERWLEKVRQSCGLIVLRDERGRLKLVDVRPREEEPFTDFDRVHTPTGKDVRWGILGRETINILEVETLETKYALVEPVSGELSAVSALEPDSVPALDQVRRVVRTREYPGDTATDVGDRRLKFSAAHTLEPSASSERKVDLMQQARGAMWEDIADELLIGWLGLYQDGLWRCTFELGKTLADVTSEGDLMVLDHDEFQVPHPLHAARTGESLIRILSITRYPAHADVEAILTPTVDVPDFAEPCPEE